MLSEIETSTHGPHALRSLAARNILQLAYGCNGARVAASSVTHSTRGPKVDPAFGNAGEIFVGCLFLNQGRFQNPAASLRPSCLAQAIKDP